MTWPARSTTATAVLKPFDLHSASAPSAIVFARGRSQNDSNIYTVNADGTDLTQVTHGGADSSRAGARTH